MSSSGAIGIDIGGTNLKAVRITRDGKVEVRCEAPTPEGRAELLAVVGETLAALDPADACGIASPGLAARDHSRIVWMQGRMDAVQDLAWSRELGRAVRVLNDAHAATLAEAWIGAGRGVQNLLLLTLGTGVGGGVIVNGQLLTGAEGKAGHLGHISLDADGPPDITNTPGSLEHLVGDYTVRERSAGRFTSTAALVDAATSGDADAQAVWERTTYHLACGLASLINCFDPEVVLLGGGIMAAGEALLEPVRAHLDVLEWRPTGHRAEIRAAELGAFAGAIGAARFAMATIDCPVT